jgi:lysyl-tRNA synthetase class 2
MELTEKLFAAILKNVFGSLKIKYNDKEIDFKTPWKRIEYQTLLRDEAKVDIETANREGLLKKAKELGVQTDSKMTKFQIEDAIYKKFCLPTLWDPTFIIHHPAGSLPLAKQLDVDPSKLGSVQLVAGGWELAKAYSELNDPQKQYDNFKEQEKIFVSGVEDAQRMDSDYVEALEHGMPPCGGWGMGIDRLVALLTDAHNLREIILFPTLKPKQK